MKTPPIVPDTKYKDVPGSPTWTDDRFIIAAIRGEEWRREAERYLPDADKGYKLSRRFVAEAKEFIRDWQAWGQA